MRGYILLILLSVPSALTGQSFIDQALNSHPLIPHPYAFLGPVAMPNGYAPLAMEGGAGLRIDSEHFLFDGYVLYDNGHKERDKTEPNPKGHDRGIGAIMRYRLHSGWAFGGGASWSELSTTNYSKNSWRPKFGVSKDVGISNCDYDDCRGQFSGQFSADWMLKGNDWQNGTQGLQLSMYLPSPSLKRHLFFREVLAVYRFHDTVTTRTDLNVMHREMSNHHSSAYAEFTIMYRF